MKPTDSRDIYRQYMCLVTLLSSAIGLQGVSKMYRNVSFSQPQTRNIYTRMTFSQFEFCFT